MKVFWGVLLLLAAGCAAPPEPGRGDGVILLADWRPGMFLPDEANAAPAFVLYGDGRAVVREEPYSEVSKLVEYHLTPERVQELFGEAADAELFDGEDYSTDVQVADGGSLVIMLRTAAREHVVEVDVPDPDDSGARGEAAEFAESLRPSNWPAGDFADPPTPYRPGRVAVTYTVADAVTRGNDVPRGWPLSEQEPIESRCVVLTGADATRAQELGEAAGRTLWQHDDATFYAWIRPLLPDETDCESTERRYL